MLGVKRHINRYFTLPLRQFFLFVTKLTVLSLFFLLALYQGVAYYHRRLLKQINTLIAQEATALSNSIAQKKLVAEQELVALHADSIRLKMKKWQSTASELHHYTQKTNVSILSYQGTKAKNAKTDQKSVHAYSIQGTRENIIQFLTLLINQQYPAYCTTLKLSHQQENVYLLHITLKKYMDQEKIKSLQLAKQAEGLGGE